MASDGERRYGSVSVTDQEYEMHVLLLSRSKLKSSMGTSTLLAGFALVSTVTNMSTSHIASMYIRGRLFSSGGNGGGRSR